MSGASDIATLNEDAAGHPFGFKISAVSSGLAGTNVTGPAGAQNTVDVQFTSTLPQDGQTISISLDLPDGTKTDITLTARSGVPDNPGDFQIGADANTTRANFQAALVSVIETKAQTSLSAASTIEAADNFFDNQPPKRVDGPPFESATALKDGDSADTVFWYEGERSTDPARQSALARVDDAIIVSYGARADEQAFVSILKNIAAFAIDTYSPGDTNAEARYNDLRGRVHDGLNKSPGNQSVDNVIIDITIAQTQISEADTRHQSSQALVKGLVADKEDVDVYEAAAQLLQLQNRLQASYQTTSILSKLSLVNFI